LERLNAVEDGSMALDQGPEYSYRRMTEEELAAVRYASRLGIL
jgi:hypothetical protein